MHWGSFVWYVSVPSAFLKVCRSNAIRAAMQPPMCAADMLAADSDKGKTKKDVSSWTGYPGGAPCNVACGLGKLDIPVAFVTALGQDARGDELANLISSMHLLNLFPCSLLPCKPIQSPVCTQLMITCLSETPFHHASHHPRTKEQVSSLLSFFQLHGTP